MKVKSPEWVANQPYGQMPYLEDPEAGLVIYESRAISRCECLRLPSQDRPRVRLSVMAEVRAFALRDLFAVDETSQESSRF